MKGWLSLIPTLLALFKWLSDQLTRWQVREGKQAEIERDIARERVEKADRNAQIAADPRNPDDVADRMQRGDF